MSDIYIPIPQETPWQKSHDIDLEKTAILVIDILGGSAGVAPGLETMAENAEKIVKKARSKNIPVIFVNDAHIKGLEYFSRCYDSKTIRTINLNIII